MGVPALGKYTNYYPLPLLSAIVLWLDSHDANTIIQSSNLVSQWFDKSGQNNHAIASGSARPSTNTRTQNSKNVIDFDGSTNFMTFVKNLALSEPFSLFVVAKYDTTTTLQSLIGRQTSSSAGQFSLRKEASGVIFNTFAFGSGGLSSQVSTTGNLNANIHFVSFQDGSGINYSLNNGTALVGTARTGYNNAVATPMGLGVTDTNTPSAYLDGWIAEVIMFNRILSASERTLIYQYLSSKWI